MNRLCETEGEASKTRNAMENSLKEDVDLNSLSDIKACFKMPSDHQSATDNEDPDTAEEVREDRNYSSDTESAYGLLLMAIVWKK